MKKSCVSLTLLSTWKGEGSHSSPQGETWGWLKGSDLQSGRMKTKGEKIKGADRGRGKKDVRKKRVRETGWSKGWGESGEMRLFASGWGGGGFSGWSVRGKSWGSLCRIKEEKEGKGVVCYYTLLLWHPRMSQDRVGPFARKRRHEQ